jgi:indolepyruvate ferredoxin oxidoreductase alpha subunit
LNRIEKGDTSLGIITSGISYQYVKEVSPEASILKIGMSNPLPWNLIEQFINSVERIVFVEENDPYLEENIKARFLIRADGKNVVPIEGELNPEIVRKAVHPGTTKEVTFSEIELPPRPPALCPGCPHRGAFYCLSKLGASSTGDIGCYTLGMMPPHNALETTVCMGASIGVLSGIEKATGREEMVKMVAAIGESTFVHSGITGLIDMVYNGSTGTVMIMDNSLTAMTGGQDNPTTGKDLRGEPAPILDLERIVDACGVKYIRVVDPHDLPEMEKALKEEMAREELSVIITRRPCIMTYRPRKISVAILDPDKCIGCKMCMKLGCPAISWDVDKPDISGLLCWPNCDLCVQVCPVDAISKDMEGLQ